MSNETAAAYYAAGRALALSDIGLPVEALALSGAPSMTRSKMRKIMSGRSNEPPPRAPNNTEVELLPRLVGAAAALRHCGGDIKKAAPELGAGILVETSGIIGALALATSEAEAKETVRELDARATQLITWRWHAIERLANALLRRRTLAGAEIAELLA